jgi:hypothetical protein
MKPRRLAPIALLCAHVVATSGCGNPCVALCEDSKECPEADVSANCEQLCEEEKESVQSLDCLAQYEDAIDCTASWDDVCAPDSSCDELIAEFESCRADACASDPDNTLCS